MKKALFMLLAALLCLCAFGGVASANNWMKLPEKNTYNWLGEVFPRECPHGGVMVSFRYNLKTTLDKNGEKIPGCSVLWMVRTPQ